MRTPRPAPSSLLRYSPLAAALACVLVPHQALAATFIVNDSTNATTSGTCFAAPAASTCSLHQAMQAAISMCSTDQNHTIQFNIPSPFVISPSFPLPTVASCLAGTLSITLDGTSQPGATVNTLAQGFDATNVVALDGTNFQSFGCALSTGNFSYGEGVLGVRGLQIRNFNYGGGGTALCGAVQVTGSEIFNNAYAIDIESPGFVGGIAAADRNIIRNNLYDAIFGSGFGGPINITNNYIGVDASGTGPAANGFGISLFDAPGSMIANNVIGNHTGTPGVSLNGSANVTITGNAIGVDASKSAAMPNAVGIDAQCVDGLIVSNNVISGNFYGGTYLSLASNAQITGNKVGVAGDGVSQLPNGGDGIHIAYGSFCGGVDPQATNAKNLKAAVAGGSNNLIVQGNTVAYNLGSGLALMYGGDAGISSNDIHQNNNHGIALLVGTGNRITSNSIYGNTGKNINLDFYGGPLPNDNGSPPSIPPDQDTGPNERQNYPVVLSVTQDLVANSTAVTWELRSTPGTSFTVEFFSNSASGTPAGETYLSPSATAVTDGNGFYSTTTTLGGLHDNIAMTAIDPLGNTSEFSGAVALTPTPAVTVSPAPPTTLNFPDTVVGAASAAQGVTLTSVGTADYVINVFDTAPSCYGGSICSSGSFTCVSTCENPAPALPFPRTLPPAQSCSINVSFTPSILGPSSETFYICDNAPGSPRSVTLNGTAIAPPPPTITPPSFDFGSVAVGAFSTSQPFTVENVAPTSTSLTAFAVSGPFQITATTCGTTLAASPGPGHTCTVDARYAPTAAGAASGSLSATAGSGVVSATLSGTAPPPPPTTMSPTSIDFGTVVVGQASSIGTFTVTNPALVPATLSPFTVTPPFVLDATTCTASLPPSSSCVADVKFAPTAVVPASGTISASANGATISSGLAGNGAPVPPPPTVTISPASVDFGSVTVGTFSTPQSFNITNPDTNPVSLGTLSTTGPYVIHSTTCGASLPPSSFCDVNVKFGPTAAGPATGSLVVPASTGTVTAGLSGTGLSALALTVSPPGFDFGLVLVGVSSAPRTFTISNPGSTAASLAPLATTGPFAVASTTCTSSLPPSASCDANVRFTPTANGNASGSLLVDSSAGPASATLVGTGLLQAVLEVATDPIDLGAGTLGGAPLSRVLTLRNGGNSALTIDRVSIGLPFTVANGCPLNLLPGESCSVTVSLDPTQVGTFSGSLTLVTNAPGGSRAIGVRAQVQARPEPLVRVSPASIGFGARMGGTQSPPQRVTIVNEGGADAAGLALAVSNPHFALLNTSCTPVLGPQQTCFADLAFQPIGFGPKQATLSVSSTAPTVGVSLSGAGCRPPQPTQGRGSRLNCAP